MASSYSTDLKLELVATGEKAGLWGSITNTNLQILEQAASGYLSLSVASSDVTLALDNGGESNGKNLYFKLTGTLAGNRTLIMPNNAERVFIIEDATDRTTANKYTLSVKATSGTPVPIPVGAVMLLKSDGTNVTKAITEKSYFTITSSSITAYTAVAGDQLLINTTQTTVTITLPASPAVGDEVVIIDARGTFGSNNVTVNRNGQPINSGTNNLALATNGQAITLVYIDSTRGWAYKTNTA
jgi:hypothetical protein|tara:strand:+ start:46 stop:771 length:726 start_codon:yes stop_codon:yes gene_type:complete